MYKITIAAILLSYSLIASSLDKARQMYKNMSTEEFSTLYQNRIANKSPYNFSYTSTLISATDMGMKEIILNLFVKDDLLKFPKDKMLNKIINSDVAEICKGNIELLLLERGIRFKMDYSNQEAKSLFNYYIDFDNCIGGKKVKLEDSKVDLQKEINKLDLSAQDIVNFTVATLKQRLPMKVDRITSITNIESKGLKIILTKEVDTSFLSANPISINKVKDIMYKLEKNVICSSKDKSELLNLGITFGFIYKNTEDKELFTYNLNKESCN
jgi:hypothetical protein